MSSARSTVHNDDIELDTLGFDPGRQPEPFPAGSIKSSTRSRRRSTYEAEEPEEGEGVSSLPPVDGGWRAYSYLAGAFVIEMFVWALPFSFSPMLDYYRKEVWPDDDTPLLPLIGSISTGLTYLLSLVIVPLFARYPNQRQKCMWIGLVVLVAGLFSASFARTPLQLVMTQGILYSVGGSVLYFSAATYLWEWFQVKRGWANGILYAGTGIGGVVFPLLIEFLLSRYGHRTTLRVLGGMFAVAIPAVLPFVRSRLPPAQVVGTKRISWGYIKNPVFWLMIIGNTIQGLGNFAPSLYLVTFATDLGLSTKTGTLCLSMLNLLSAFGYGFMGWASDKNLPVALAVSAVGSAVAVFAIWGTSNGFAGLLGFSLLFGFTSPSWAALWPAMVSHSQTDPTQTLPLYALFVATRGLGSVMVGPISSKLLSPSTMGNSFKGAALAYGLRDGQYAGLILFTGVSMALAIPVCLYPFVKRAKGDDGVPDRREREEL